MRRSVLIAGVALCGAALPGWGSTDVNARLTEAAASIDQALQQSSMPGLVVGITDRKELRTVILHGYEDLKLRKPVSANSRFAIGSVSKAFTAIALMQLAEEQRFDTHAPVTRYLSSLVLKSRFAPITGHDLLSHTSGLPNYLPDSASSRYAAIELKDFEPSYAPGAHWWYSNTGYQLLGYVLENIEREPYTKILKRRVLDPLGMVSTSAVIDDAERAHMAVSYVRWPYDESFVEAPWFEYSAGDGSLVSTVADMAGYVRFILNRGSGDHHRILSERMFTTLTTPVLEDYGYGLWVRKDNGRTVISHTGGIAGFHSAIEAHMDDGFGLMLLCNGWIDDDLKQWIVNAVTAAFRGTALPAAPAQRETREAASDYAGQFSFATAETGTPQTSLLFTAAQGRLYLQVEGGNVLLERMDKDVYRATGNAAGIYPFVFGRSGKDGKGIVTNVSHGERWYRTDGFTDPIAPATPKDYAAYVGHFVNNGPEGPVARVFVRNGRLMMLVSEDENPVEQPLEPLSPAVFRIGKEDYSPERARFDTLVDGQALRLFVSGVPLYRKDIP